KDDFKAQALISHLAPAGKIAATKEIPELDAKMLSLSNGIKVYLKKTDIEKDKVMFTAYSWGGVSKVDDKNVPNAEMLGGFIANFGIGDLSVIDLRKLLTGKVVKLSPGLDDLSEEISGNASPADLETLFELNYLYFTKPRFDEQSFNALKARYLAFVQNMKNDVRMTFSDSITAIMANHSPRVYSLGEKMIESLDFNGMKNIYQERFKNPGDFFFVISGNFDEAKLNAYIEKYIASLKVTPENENYIDRGIRPPAKETSVHFTREMATPKASVYVAYAKEDKYSEKGAVYMDVISKLLSKKYIDEIREKEGGTYGVGVRASMEKRPYENARLRLMFDCDAEKMEKLKGIALDEISKLQKGVIDETDLKEAKQNLLKERGEKVQKLSFWHNRLLHYGTDNEFLMTDKEYKDFVNSIDAKTITKVAKKFFKKAVKIEVVMTPKK
ncbi:MAG: insulinase family protein, partial [Bacteroidales bacterium]|nr:insulinase family protein [Bacteroidales bacterium]